MSEKMDFDEFKQYPYAHHTGSTRPHGKKNITYDILKKKIDLNLNKLNIAILTHNGKNHPKTMTNQQLENIFKEVQTNVNHLIQQQKDYYLVDVDEPIRKSKHNKNVHFSPSVIKAGTRKRRKTSSTRW